MATSVSVARPEPAVVRVRSPMLVCPKCGSVYTREVDHCGLDGARLAESSDDPNLGRTIGRYRIDAAIGAGGMARVYRAFHTTLEQDIALKVLHGEFAADKDIARRFHREAKALSRIKHDNVVNVTDFGSTQEGLLFMVMDFLDGPTLSQLLREEGTLSPKRAAAILRQLCAGLGAAHARGYVHRDLKPGNVVLVTDHDREVVKILDFGLVRITEPDDETVALTQQGMFFGTPIYMSPEQLRGEEAGPRADLYALGVVLYQMLVGNPPFQGDIKQLAQQHLNEAPPVPPLPYGGLTEIALDLLEKDPERRPASAKAVMGRIDELTIAPEPSHRPSKRPRRASKRPHPADAPTRAEPRGLNAPVLAHERSLIGADDEPEQMSQSIRAALGMRAYVKGWVPLAAFFIVAAAAVYFFWSGGQLPQPIAGWMSSSDTPSRASALEAPPSPDPAPEVETPAPEPELVAPKPRRATKKPARTAKRATTTKKRPAPATTVRPEPPPPKPAPPPAAPPPADDTPVETVEVEDYETKPGAPEPDPGAPPAKSFSDLDMSLGWALNQKGLAWADLAAVAKGPARQWTRWYKKSSGEPDRKLLDDTFYALMGAVEDIEVDAALLKRKLSRCQRILKNHASHAGGARYDGLGTRFASLKREASFSPLRRDAVALSAEISLLETDLQVFQSEASRAPPPTSTSTSN